MEDDVTTMPVSEEPAPDRMRTYKRLLWSAVVAAALIAGIAGGIMHPKLDLQTGAEVFGLETFIWWSLVVLVVYTPIIVVFYAVNYAIDSRVRTADRPADTPGEVAAAEERS